MRIKRQGAADPGDGDVSEEAPSAALQVETRRQVYDKTKSGLEGEQSVACYRATIAYRPTS